MSRIFLLLLLPLLLTACVRPQAPQVQPEHAPPERDLTQFARIDIGRPKLSESLEDTPANGAAFDVLIRETVDQIAPLLNQLALAEVDADGPAPEVLAVQLELTTLRYDAAGSLDAVGLTATFRAGGNEGPVIARPQFTADATETASGKLVAETVRQFAAYLVTHLPLKTAR